MVYRTPKTLYGAFSHLVFFRWGTHFYVSLFLSVRPFVRPLRTISKEPYIIWSSFMVQMYKMIISPGVFFNFKILTFWFVWGLKGQKWPKMTKNFCLSHLIFQESHTIHLWYIYLYKNIISPGIFSFFFFKFWFSGSSGTVVKEQKMT